MLSSRAKVRLILCAVFVALTATAAAARQRTDFGTLSIQVRPPDAEIFIDGERWVGPETAGALVVQLAPGTHHVELRSPGRQTYAAEITIRAGETTPLNVALPQGAPAPPREPREPQPPAQRPMMPPSGGITQSPDTGDGFVFAPDVRISDINHKTGTLVGAYGGYVFASQFLIGLGGYWQADSNQGVHLVYGGPVLEWRMFPGRTIGFNLHGLIGAGEFYVDHGYYGRYPAPYDGHGVNDGHMGYGYPYYYGYGHSDTFFVAEPEAQIVVRFGAFARLQGGVGYRATSQNGASGVSGSISVQFGR